jgi:hypothetical protein
MDMNKMVALSPDNIRMMCKITMVGLFVYDNKGKFAESEAAEVFLCLTRGLLDIEEKDADMYQMLPEKFHIEMKQMAEEITSLSKLLDKSKIEDLLKSFNYGSDT